MPRRREALSLSDDLIGRETSVGTPNLRDDAERARKVAAVLDFEEGTSAIRPLRRRGILKGVERSNVSDRDVGPFTGKNIPEAVAVRTVGIRLQVL